MRPSRIFSLVKATNIVLALAAALLLTGVANHASAAERITRQIKVGNLTRDYIAHIPSDAKSRGPISVIFAFHPLLGSGSGFEKQTNLARASTADRFIIVYPDGYRRSWNATECCGAAQRSNIDDIAFIKAIFADLGQYAKISPDRNFAVGFSNGAMFSQKLVCSMSERFAGFVTSGGLYNTKYGCNLKRPVSAVFMSGLEDPYSPFNGGISKADGSNRPGVPAIASIWAKYDSCSSTKTATRLSSITCTLHTGCSGGSEIYSCAIPNLGHWWPGQVSNSKMAERKLGPARPDLPSASDALSFFAQHGG